MHEVGFEPTNSKRRGLKPRAFDHFATHAYIYLQVPIKKGFCLKRNCCLEPFGVTTQVYMSYSL